MRTHFIPYSIVIAPIIGNINYCVAALRLASMTVFLQNNQSTKLWAKALYNTQASAGITMHEPIPYAHAKLFLFWHNSYKYSFEHYQVLSSVWYLLTNWLSINFKFPMWEYYVVKLGPIWTQFVINPVHMYEVGLSGWFCPSVLTNVCLPCGNVWNLNKCCMWWYYDNITSTW